ncbi:hypothetical protein RND81_13G004400 [Saponaria officinalis]|uniref:Uncharacterized protein n=1 Tax=Saponaria officinalis TaxID=3572 RepID=A0AAW1GVA7_SAPOF
MNFSFSLQVFTKGIYILIIDIFGKAVCISCGNCWLSVLLCFYKVLITVQNLTLARGSSFPTFRLTRTVSGDLIYACCMETFIIMMVRLAEVFYAFFKLYKFSDVVNITFFIITLD